MGIAEELIPVATLLLGAGLGHLQANWGSSRSARQEARQVFAEVWERAWDTSPDAWINLLIYRSRLRGYLRAAGVARGSVLRFNDALAQFWQSTNSGGEAEVRSGVPSWAYRRLEFAAETIWNQLDDSLVRRLRWRFGLA